MIYETLILALAIVYAINRYCEMQEYKHRHSKEYVT